MKVRLKQKQDWRQHHLQCCFNSMKVRLKHDFVELESWFLDQFQFHEGPIKTVSSLQSGLCDYMFQFHEGPIKTTARTRLTARVVVSIP